MEKMMRNVYLTVACLLSLCGAVFGHEKRLVGDSEWVVGFLNEPTFSGQMNAVDLRVNRDGKPVTGLEKSLKAEVFFEEEPRSFPLAFKTRYNQPGAYAGYFLPSKPGHYSFVITGDAEGKPVEERFSSAEGKFSEVRDSEALRFP
jgi:hypothetical protein